ncbi:haloacid dehalogenase [Spirochaetia bacterium]|nr:haloacid dehalogenase [Spirochaetia bacterium]
MTLPDSDTIKGIALDLDGTTLMPGAVLGERTLKTLRSLLAHHIQIIICTGRSCLSAERFRASIGTTGPMVFFNGAEVTDVPSGTVLKTTLLDWDIVDFCVDLARQYNAYFQVFFPKPPCAETGSLERLLMADTWRGEAEVYQKFSKTPIKTSDLKEAIHQNQEKGCLKAMFIAQQPHVLATVRHSMEEAFGSKIYIAQSQSDFLEIMDATANKGNGLRVALAQRGLEQEAILAFGDGENDLPLFKAAAFSIVPSQARASVKSAADLVVGPNSEEGVAAFLETFFKLELRV